MTQEQWMQVLAIVTPVLVSGTAMIGGATWYLAGRIERVRAVTSQVAELSPKVADLCSRMLAAETRLGAIERLLERRPIRS